MKRNLLCIVALALAAVLCTGCGVKDEDLKSDPLVNADGTAPVGKTLVALLRRRASPCWTTRISLPPTVCTMLLGSTENPSPMKTARARRSISTMPS